MRKGLLVLLAVAVAGAEKPLEDAMKDVHEAHGIPHPDGLRDLSHLEALLEKHGAQPHGDLHAHRDGEHPLDNLPEHLKYRGDDLPHDLPHLDLPDNLHNAPRYNLRGLAHLPAAHPDHPGLAPEKLVPIFNQYDVDKDEKLSVNELANWLEQDVKEKVYTGMSDMELKKELLALTRADYVTSAEQLLSDGDADNDNLLTLAEFETAMEPDPTYGDSEL